MNEMATRLEPILTVTEVAEYLKLSKSKVYYMIQKRQMPYIRIGRNVRVRESDLQIMLQNSIIPPTASVSDYNLTFGDLFSNRGRLKRILETSKLCPVDRTSSYSIG